MGKTQLEKFEATNGQINSNTECNSKQTIEKANERPEWLPDGWNVEFRTRKSGANMGYGYKCYIDPLNGCKFYSKPEVLRYLETIKSNNCTSEKEKRCNTMHSPSNVVIEKSAVGDLPPGWIKEVRTRKNSNGIRKDPFYIDPASGYVFRSKKDALRYLESGDISSCAFKPNKRQIQDEDKFNPSSAGKRQKLKQSAAKRQLFVGKEISDKSSLELPDANSSEKAQDVKVSSGMMVAPVPTGTSVVKMHSPENAAANPPEMKKASDPDDLQEKNHVMNVMENANEKNHSNPTVSKNKESNVARRFSRRLAGVEPHQLANNLTNEQTLQVPERNLRKSRTILDADLAWGLNGVPEIEHSQKMQAEVLKKSNKLSVDQAVFREQPNELETEKIEDNKPEQNQYSLSRDTSLPSLKVAMETIRAELPSPDNHHNANGLASEACVLKENKLHAIEIGKSGSQEILTNSNKSGNKKEHRNPCRASKRLAGFEPELTSNFVSGGKAPEYKSKKSKREVNADLHKSEGGPAMELADHASVNGEASHKSRKPPKIPPITNDQQEKLEDDEMDDEKSEAQLSFAFHYSWSDPCLEFAINTLTGALPVEDKGGNGSPGIPESDMFHKTKMFENVTGSSSDRNPQVNSNKPKNKKESKMPRRLSKRLAGHEPELLPTERAPEYATRKSCKGKPTATLILTEGTSGHLDAGDETKLINHTSGSLKTNVGGESSNNSEKPYDAQTVPKEQLQKLEAENIDDDRSEPQFPLPFEDSWSDPCLEFAIKTLTGTLPVDAASDILPHVTLEVNDPPNKELPESVVQTSITEEVHDNSNQPQNKKEPNTVCEPSTVLLGQPELRTSSTYCENDPKFVTGEFYGDEGNITRKLDGGECLQIEAENVTQLADYSKNINTPIHEEPLKENEQVLEGESVPAEQQLQTETVNLDNSESHFCASFMDSWSDPCLEFAFKTLTGAIPVEENIAIQGCFQEPANRHDLGDGGSTLPDFGSSSFSQCDISFHKDIGKKSIAGQQSSMSSSFLSLEKSSLQGCTGVDPQKHNSQCNNNFQGR